MKITLNLTNSDSVQETLGALRALQRTEKPELAPLLHELESLVAKHARQQVPIGYRLLAEGETIRSGDIYLRGGQWLLTNHSGGRWSPHGYWPMARKIKVINHDG